MEKKMELDLKALEELLNDIPKENELFVDHSFGISRFVSSYLKAYDLTQRELATRLDKSEAEISKWLGGQHNFTLRSLCKIESALGVNIINVPTKLTHSVKQLTGKKIIPNKPTMGGKKDVAKVIFMSHKEKSEPTDAITKSNAS